MNAARILKQIDALRADMTSKLDALTRSIAEESGETEAMIYMSPEQYATRAHVSTVTVRKWLRQGLPCVRRGRVVRIKVAEADVWTPSAQLERSAQDAAHKGR